MSRKATTSTEQSASTVSNGPATAIDVAALFEEHHHRLMRFVLRYLRNPEDAEDVVQNTFVEAMRCADRFSGLSKPSTWLFGIALNLARNQMRRNYAHAPEQIDEAELEAIEDCTADPANLIETRDISNKVQALLDELPDCIRATFEAVLDGNSTYEQAAADLNIPIGTVRSRVSRVRAAVRARYA
jgi:RNA polymerase sigma-70 factor (ECF subfamily)